MSYSTYYSPEILQWEKLLAKNTSNSFQRQNIFGINRQLIHEIRQELIVLAEEYEQELATVARNCNISWTKPFEKLNSNKPLIASGHQPAIFHKGILEKEKALELLLMTKNQAGVWYIIDLDKGSGGGLSFPYFANNQVIIQWTTLSYGRSLYASQYVEEAKFVRHLFQGILRETQSTNINQVKVHEAMILFEKLEGQKVADANAIVRRVLSPTSYIYALPISKICGLEVFRVMKDYWVANERELTERYNKERLLYLEQHATPSSKLFKELELDAFNKELPFWTINNDLSTRETAKMQNKELSGGLLFPKAMLLSIFLRYIGSDFFIHGKGGATYDGFTDYWLKGLGYTPNEYSVVSADGYVEQICPDVRQINYREFPFFF